MKNDLLYVISVKIDELAAELSKRNSIIGTLVDARVEGDTLSIYLRPLDRMASTRSSEPKSATASHRAPGADATLSARLAIRKRRARGKRNRMKTRGWSVVGQVTNEYGQKANVYQPFAEALKDTSISRTEQRAIVSKILRSNGNIPSADSIEYFLEKTLQYLKETRGYESGSA
jgi:hypothetical protein